MALLLGLFRTFRHTDGRVTIGSVICGFLAFALTKLLPDFPADWEVATPLIVCALVFIVGGLVNRAVGRPVREEADALLDTLAEPERAAERIAS